MTASSNLDPVAERSTAFGSEILLASPALKRFALRLTKDHAAAEDLVQDTLIRAWAARARFEVGTNIKAWLFRIARNAFLSGARHSRRQVAWDPDRHQPMAIQAATQDEALYFRDLRAALSRLPAAQQKVLLLIAQDDMSISDAADELGIPAGTVKSRVSRARSSILAYVMGEATTDDERPPTNSSQAGQTVAVISTTDNSPADRSGLSRYQQWKASGGTFIG